MFGNDSNKGMKSLADAYFNEVYKGKHGQSETEYQDGRSNAGKMISGDSKGSGANYSYKAKNTGPNPAGGSTKPQGQAKMNNKDKAYLAHQKAQMNHKEELQIYSALADAYASMYEKKQETDEYVIIDEYAVSEENAIALAEGKKKCKEGYKYDSDKKKCVKKEKKSSSNTTIIVGRGYGHGGHHDHDDDKEDGNDGGTGGDGGGGDGGGGGE